MYWYLTVMIVLSVGANANALVTPIIKEGDRALNTTDLLLYVLGSTPLYCEASEPVTSNEFDNLAWFEFYTNQMLPANAQSNTANGQRTYSTKFVPDFNLVATKYAYKCCTLSNGNQVNCQSIYIINKSAQIKSFKFLIFSLFTIFYALLV